MEELHWKKGKNLKCDFVPTSYILPIITNRKGLRMSAVLRQCSQYDTEITKTHRNDSRLLQNTRIAARHLGMKGTQNCGYHKNNNRSSKNTRMVAGDDALLYTVLTCVNIYLRRAVLSRLSSWPTFLAFLLSPGYVKYKPA